MVVILRCFSNLVRCWTISSRNFSNNNVFNNCNSEYRYVRRYQGKVKAVIFDWAGTVVDHGCYSPVMAFLELFRREGVDITVEEARGPMGAHKLVHIEKILSDPNVLSRWKAAHNGSPPNQTDVNRLYKNFVPIQLGCLPEHCHLIPGVAATVNKLRVDFGMKIGTTTGFARVIQEAVVKSAAEEGFKADNNVAADQVPQGRPCPHMVWMNAIQLNVHPIEAIVKVDDTVDGVLEGLSAGCWAVGIAKTGNYMGATQSELASLAPDVLHARLRRANDILYGAGVHYVVNDVTCLPAVIEDINRRLSAGEKP